MVAAVSGYLNGALPHVRTRQFGREEECARGRAFILDDAVPLLTLTGPGGVGKTRLALAVAHDLKPAFADGVVWIDLAPLTDPTLVTGTLAHALGIAAFAGQTVAEALVQYLRPRQTLLLLDNCEHLVGAVAETASRLLTACPALQILSTSRMPLRIRGEQEFPIGPLPFPPAGTRSLECLERNGAVKLFVDRARAIHPGFGLDPTNAQSVAAICQQVDGLPLAIELAAARSKYLSPEALLAQLTDRLSVLDGGQCDLPPRQRTMRDAIAWSYDLLAADAQALFRRLAVFAGGFDLEAVAAVGGGDPSQVLNTLRGLADHSLIQHDVLSGAGSVSGSPRFRMLETIRQYAAELLAADPEHGATQGAHAAHFLSLAERAEGQLFGGPEQPRHLGLLEANHDNFRAAFEWFDARGDAEGCLRLGAALWEFWGIRGHKVEGRQRLRRALARSDGSSELLRMAATRGLAAIELGLGNVAEVARLLETTLVVDRRLNDKGGMAHAHRMLGLIAWSRGHLDEAAARLEESLALYRDVQEHGGCLWCHRRPWCARSMTGVLLGEVGAVAGLRGADLRAKALMDEALPLLHQMGDHVGIAMVLRHQGEAERRQGNARGAEASLLGALEKYRELGMKPHVASVLLALAACAGDLGEGERVAALAREAHRVYDEAGDETGMAAAEKVLRNNDATGAGALTVLPAQGERGPSALTRREQEILGLLCQRLTNPEIAAQLFISPMTARNHVSNILSKLGASDRRDAAAIAARSRLV